MRAMAQNPAAAKLMGVNVERLTIVTWMLAMMMAALAGILAAPKVFLSPLMMANVVVNGFAAAVLGGITSLPGAIIGGLAIGWIDQFVGLYFPEWRGMASFLIIVLVLTIRPNGLLGKTVRKKV
jgi:branched-chain amino acid transport system permease protein